jgi:hypothetical protein
VGLRKTTKALNEGSSAQVGIRTEDLPSYVSEMLLLYQSAPGEIVMVLFATDSIMDFHTPEG